MPLYKPCKAPTDGGSAKGVVRYILGYELGAKREEWEIRNASYHSLIAESLARADLGVGVAWSPAVGEGIRPSSVLVLNVAALATADVEMQALHQANKRTKSPTHHEVFAFGDDVGLSDEKALDAVRRVYERVGLGNAAMVMAVHRDSYDDKDGHLLLHVHVARSGIDPTTLRAYNHQRINTRVARAERAVEMEMGLHIERRDLAIVDHSIDGVPFIRDSTFPERIGWNREEREERLMALERSRYIDNALREGSFERYAEARVEPRMREVVQRAQDTGYRPHAIDVANTAARLGCVLQLDAAGGLQLRDVSTARLREKQREEIEQAIAATADWKSLERDENLGKINARHKGELKAETRRLMTEGAVAPLTPAMTAELKKSLRDPRILADEIAVERAFIAAIDKDPGSVARTLTQSDSTFGRDNVDRYLVDRIDDVGEIERLAHKIFTEDQSLVLLSGDTDSGIWSTREMQAIEQEVADFARELAERPDTGFDPARRAQAIAAMEADRSVPGKPFTFSDEQKTALSKHGGLVAVKGSSGVGKTTMMEALRRDAEIARRPIRGVTIAQAAAIRLEVEAGFGAVNTAFALLADNPRRELIPRNGVLVVDEAGMVDSRTMRALLRLGKERNTDIWAIYDTRQGQAIGAGGSARILEAAAQEAGTFAELTENRRQKNEYHRRAVALTSNGIETEDPALFQRAVELLEQNDALAFVPNKDIAIAEAVAWYTGEQNISEDVLLVATDRDTVRYLNEELLRQRPDRGYEIRYYTESGKRGLAVGDRFIFGENNTKLGAKEMPNLGISFDCGIGVVNGDTGAVVHAGKIAIGVQLDRTGQVILFDSRKYTVWDHGYATTVSRAQGASVRALGGIADGAATAEAFHVLIGRSKEALKVLVPETAFEDATDLAQHLSENIVAKGTSIDISAQVAKRGGPDTDYARNVNAQRMSAENPDRQEWEREWTAMRNRRDIEVRNLAAEYRAKMAIANPQEKKRLRVEQRKAEAAIVDAHKPDDFGVWLHRKAERDEETLERIAALFEDRELKRQHAQRVEYQRQHPELAPHIAGFSKVQLDEMKQTPERKQTPAERATQLQLAEENAHKALRRAAGIPEPKQEKPEHKRGISRGGMGR